MENRNDVFITDHGSIRDSRNRAFRVRRAVPGLGLLWAASFSAPDRAAATAVLATAAAAAPIAGRVAGLADGGGAGTAGCSSGFAR